MKEITYDFNIYKQPSILDGADAVVSTILNVIFMKPGNLPSLPKIGADIEQYLYRFDDQFNSDKLISDIKFGCGTLLVGASLGTITFNVLSIENNPYFLLQVNVLTEGKSQQIVLALQKKDEVVRFNYKVIDN